MGDNETYKGTIHDIVVKDKRTNAKEKYLIQDASLTDRVEALDVSLTNRVSSLESEQITAIPMWEIDEICQ